MAMLQLPDVFVRGSRELNSLKWQQPRTKTEETVTVGRRSSSCGCLSGCFRHISKSYCSSLALSKEIRSITMIDCSPGYVTQHSYLQRGSCKVCLWQSLLDSQPRYCRSGSYSSLRWSGNGIYYLHSNLPGVSKQFVLNLSDSPADTVFDLSSLYLTSLSHDVKQGAFPSSCVRRESRLCRAVMLHKGRLDVPGELTFLLSFLKIHLIMEK